MRYHTLDTHTGAIIKESDYPPQDRVSPPKRTFVQKQPGIYLTQHQAWGTAIAIFLLGAMVAS